MLLVQPLELQANLQLPWMLAGIHCRKVLCSKNDKRRNNTSISTNAFDYRNPLLTTWLCLKLLTDLSINNAPSSFLFSNCESAFIHIVHIFRFDIVFRNHFFQIIKPTSQSFW